MPGRPVLARLVCLWSVLLVLVAPLVAVQRGSVDKPVKLQIIELREPDGQILSYRHNTGSTEVRMQGTRLAPGSRIKLKVESRPGFLEIDINRGDITGLQPARRYGRDFLTYVLWAVSVDGKASNLGEITFKGDRPISINVTTPYQTFWLMVTAEPDYAVADPSPKVVLYSLNQEAINESPEKKALPIGGDLFYYTHYTSYDSAPGAGEPEPNELLQARKAVELASKSGILAMERPVGAPVDKEEERARETLKQARAFLAQAEVAYGKNPAGRDVVQFSRTAAQIAENARALALGPVGGVFIRQLENDLAMLREELSRSEAEADSYLGELSSTRRALTRTRGALSRTQGKLSQAQKELSQTQEDLSLAQEELSNVEPQAEEPPPKSVLADPVSWVALVGWGLALLLLFRRRLG